ncbi:MAG: aminopeptidase P family protein [Phycisphaeraceae bacterium]|nr:aminopeptidase P family protein [Phycisphaeraceae bacterium]
MPADHIRISRIKTAMRRVGLDALILRLPENIVMSMGVWPMNGFSYALITSQAGPTALIAPSCEDQEMADCWSADVRFFTWPRLEMSDPLEAIRRELVDLAAKHNLKHARIGYEGSFEYVAPSHNGGEVMVACESSIAYLKSVLPKAQWTDASDLLNNLRATKTPMEVERLRIAHKVAAMGLRKFQQSAQPGIRETELAAEVYSQCLVGGMNLPGVKHLNVYPQISSGPNAHRAWRPIVSTTKRRLQEGELAVLELAVCVDGFWADVTRVKAAGEPLPIQRDAYAAVKKAQAAAIKSIKAGIRASRPHQVATDILIKAGFEKQIVHLTGHGVGFRYHEPEPFLLPANSMKLRVGHVCSVEPGLYDPAWGGIRIEDNVVVTAEGAEVLTHAAKKLT